MSILWQQKENHAQVSWASMCINEGKQAGGANIWYAVLAEIGGLRAVCRGWPGPEVLLSRLRKEYYT